MSQISISPNAQEGDIYFQGSWAEAYSGTTGTLLKLAADNQTFYSVLSTIYYIHRGFIAFPLTSIPAGSVVTAVHLKMRITLDSGMTGYFNLGTQSDTLVADDYNNVTTTNYATLAGDGATSYRDITFNDAGIAYIQAIIGGTAKFCIRSNYDENNIAPAPGGTAQWWNQTYATVSERPLLVVTIRDSSFLMNFV